MGLNALWDEWCARSDQVFVGHDYEGTQKIVDDGLTSAETLEQLEERVRRLLQSCSKAGVTLSKKKFAISMMV